ncbi:Aquaporin AQPcic [Chionoecetes opilio]|uniref:Aquaporin AQPcic n=1 Tax=Chionoecetes opilio TaxID=41210 RepID=A0A8J5CDL4_CHIOP|nr:Aquaporin AQPcic [Chionoecetes opilio]
MGKIKDMHEYLGTNEFMKLATWKAVAAEAVGTLVIVLVVCGACITWEVTQPPTREQIAFAVGIVVFCMVQALGHVSGGHFNPAVTCGMLVARYVSVVRALLYIIAQCLGAMAGSGILKGLRPQAKQDNLGMTKLGEGVSEAQGFGVEVMITFILVLTVFGVCDERRNDAKGCGPLAIGLSVTACHMGAIPFTGAAMNPARSFGPAVITGIWANHWMKSVSANFGYMGMWHATLKPIRDNPAWRRPGGRSQGSWLGQVDVPCRELLVRGKLHLYLGHVLSSDSVDDLDIKKQLQKITAVGNTILRRFSFCTKEVKLELFRSYCYNKHCNSLWARYRVPSMNRLRVCHNDILKRLLGFPRWSSSSETFVSDNIKCLDVIRRHSVSSLTLRVEQTCNSVVSRVRQSEIYTQGAVAPTPRLTPRRVNVSHVRSHTVQPLVCEICLLPLGWKEEQ